MKKKIFVIALIVAAIVCCVLAVIKALYTPKKLDLTFDAAYYWTTNSFQDKTWIYEELATGHKYFLYLPPKYREDKELVEPKIPLIVTFHGSCEKGGALRKMGRPFVESEFQKKIYPEGAAVLVVLSRGDYFTDTHSMSLLIQNIVLKYSCIDSTNIIGVGFSQGAKYVVELACSEPALFRGIISGSGFYQITLKELIKVLPVSFYSALSENDMGIYEQGLKTAKLCAKWCKNSRYMEYKTRYHFWVELDDPTGVEGETVTSWLIDVVNR